MMINTKTNEFMQQLTDLINSTELPVCNVRLCLDLVRAQLLQVEQQVLAKEAESNQDNHDSNEN